MVELQELTRQSFSGLETSVFDARQKTAHPQRCGVRHRRIPWEHVTSKNCTVSRKLNAWLLGHWRDRILKVVNFFSFLLSNLMCIPSPLSVRLSLFCIVALAEAIFLYQQKVVFIKVPLFSSCSSSPYSDLLIWILCQFNLYSTVCGGETWVIKQPVMISAYAHCHFGTISFLSGFLGTGTLVVLSNFISIMLRREKVSFQWHNADWKWPGNPWLLFSMEIGWFRKS